MSGRFLYIIRAVKGPASLRHLTRIPTVAAPPSEARVGIPSHNPPNKKFMHWMVKF